MVKVIGNEASMQETLDFSVDLVTTAGIENEFYKENRKRRMCITFAFFSEKIFIDKTISRRKMRVVVYYR